MLPESTLKKALFCLNGVLVQARKMAFEDVPKEKLAELLDYAEELPLMIAEPEVDVERFRSRIKEISERFNCAFVLDRFDD